MVVVVVVVLWPVPLMRVRGRGGVDGRLGALLCFRMAGRAVRGTGEQRRESDRDDRTDLSGPPRQLGEAVKPCVPRCICGMAGPQWVTGVGIVACPTLAPEWHRLRGIWKLAGKGGVALVGVVRQPVVRTAFQGAAARCMTVGVVRVGVLRCPASRADPGRVAVTRRMVRIGVLRRPVGQAERGSAERLPRLWGVLPQAAVGPARPGLSVGRGSSRLAGTRGVVLALAGGWPVRAAGLPGPVVCQWFIIVTHILQHSTARVKGT
jgi:hypothetical protein